MQQIESTIATCISSLHDGYSQPFDETSISLTSILQSPDEFLSPSPLSDLVSSHHVQTLICSGFTELSSPSQTDSLSIASCLTAIHPQSSPATLVAVHFPPLISTLTALVVHSDKICAWLIQSLVSYPSRNDVDRAPAVGAVIDILPNLVNFKACEFMLQFATF
jgi:hypothetical protein